MGFTKSPSSCIQMFSMEYDKNLVNKIKKIINLKQATISVAESVTAGHIQAALSLADEAAEYFQGGITCYNLGQKTRHLNIEPILAEQSNCIHQKVAAQMAIEVSKLFISDFGLGITGYATMVPEIEKEGLFAFAAISYQQNILLQKKLTSKKESSLEVQVDYTQQVLKLLFDFLKKK